MADVTEGAGSRADAPRRPRRRRTVGEDERRLHELGYRQELSRGWSAFTNFAISFTIISVLAGTFTTFGPAWAERRPDRDLDRLAGDLRARADWSPCRWPS